MHSQGHGGHGSGHNHFHLFGWAELAFLSMLPGYRFLLLLFALIVLCGGV